MVEGKEITLSGKVYTLPPIPLIGMAKLGPRFSSIGKDFSEDSVGALADAIFFSLKRNYPEISRDLVEQNIDLTNLTEITTAFVEVNNLTEAKPSGEAPAGQ